MVPCVSWIKRCAVGVFIVSRGRCRRAVRVALSLSLPLLSHRAQAVVPQRVALSLAVSGSFTDTDLCAYDVQSGGVHRWPIGVFELTPHAKLTSEEDVA